MVESNISFISGHGKVSLSGRFLDGLEVKGKCLMKNLKEEDLTIIFLDLS